MSELTSYSQASETSPCVEGREREKDRERQRTIRAPARKPSIDPGQIHRCLAM